VAPSNPIYNHHFHSKHHWKSSQILFQSSQPSCLSLASDDICLGVIRLFVARNSQWLGCRLRQAIQECTHPDVRDRALMYYSCRRYSASRCIVSKDRCLVLERKKCARDMHWVKATNINDGCLPQSIHLQLYIHSFGGGLLLRRFYRSCFAFFCMFVLPSQIIFGSIALTLKLLHGPGRSFPILAVWVPQKSSSGMSLEANDFRFLNLHHDHLMREKIIRGGFDELQSVSDLCQRTARKTSDSEGVVCFSRVWNKSSFGRPSKLANLKHLDILPTLAARMSYFF